MAEIFSRLFISLQSILYDKLKLWKNIKQLLSKEEIYWMQSNEIVLGEKMVLLTAAKI